MAEGKVGVISKKVLQLLFIFLSNQKKQDECNLKLLFIHFGESGKVF